MTRPAPLQQWHAIAEARDPAGLADLLAEDVTFRSPAVHTPQEGKALTTAYLTAAIAVLAPPSTTSASGTTTPRPCWSSAPRSTGSPCTASTC